MLGRASTTDPAVEGVGKSARTQDCFPFVSTKAMWRNKLVAFMQVQFPLESQNLVQ